LAGLEVHDVVPDGSAPERARRIARFLEDAQIDAEAAWRLGPAIDWNTRSQARRD
jgi:hypothetical protein